MINIEELKKTDIKDGDILVMPDNIPIDTARKFMADLQKIGYNNTIITSFEFKIYRKGEKTSNNAFRSVLRRSLSDLRLIKVKVHKLVKNMLNTVTRR